ncbi:alpha-ketoglutarate-dependent dioxygenase AlkB family protein [Solilutibacter tolerans]|uniref:DNA-N1-methyladenine dioxygenase n=1 Tax=Solilutibacter tolerans TaxID=1604334 RepID=A0A1N6N8Y2_9GAMM|nr:alpha-ketoglutarate-dependent dioxygenase AlkB [Lysobacter tolerans]SIP88511.1 DNA-N1-methyladenine dioxygenase [Lysobacter tolerans]
MDLFAASTTIPGIDHRPGWLSWEEADALFNGLRDTVEWEVHRIRMFGRMVDSPRLSCWLGDEDAVYRYSGTIFEPRPWPTMLDSLRARLAAECGRPFNSVLANLYRDGRDAMGWHRDDEPELGDAPLIASLSLGATRRFLLKDAQGRRHAMELANGDLLSMSGDSQRRYRHALPRTAKAVGPRINLTFRNIFVHTT